MNNQPTSQTIPYESLCKQCIEHMGRTVDLLASRVPAPELIDHHGNRVFRYTAQSIHQAIVLKLARLVSNLGAALLLSKSGHVHEQAALQRMITEGDEDVTFLALAVLSKDITELHSRFLDAFWEEEFDQPTALASTQTRPSISRKRINAWIARHPFSGTDESTGAALTTTMHKTYSGYVHGAAPQILDLYGGNPPRFHMKGMLRTPRHKEHTEELLNYFYRAIIAFAFAAKAFGDEEMFADIRDFSQNFAQETGVG